MNQPIASSAEGARESIEVRPSSAAAYPVYVTSGWGERLEQMLRYHRPSSIFLITQEGLDQLFLGELIDFLQPIFPDSPFTVEGGHLILLRQGEEHKHLSELLPVCNRLVEKGVDRHSLIIAAGGGVVGDFAGFVAATILRGIRFVQLPSTLLAAVDSSVGGKVAVNVDLGKNMVGAFHQPLFVWCNSDLFATLPEREWRCGLAEMVKHALLEESGALFEYLLESASRLRENSSPELQKAILDSVSFKAWIVSQDETEQGIRAILNLGHTTAHAIESHTHYQRYSHGEAVAIGLVTALLLSQRYCRYPQDEFDAVLQLMKRLSLPICDCTIEADDLLSHMLYDKKSLQGKPRFVLLHRRGVYSYGNEIEAATFRDVWQRQREIGEEQ